jgi:hypothetical protein
MQVSLIVITKAMQQSRTSAAPFTDRSLLRYRGICLTELMALVTEVNFESQAMAFDCIQLVMLAELQLEPTGPWAYHMEATRRLIGLQGGIGSMFYKSSLRNLLINYMELDILTTTTCNVSLLNARDVNAQSTYIPLLAHREEETITTAGFSPIHLLQAIVDTNKLRLRCSQPGSDETGRHIRIGARGRLPRSRLLSQNVLPKKLAARKLAPRTICFPAHFQLRVTRMS